MDPDETLAQLRQAYSDWEDDNGNVDAGNRMRDAAWALDEWLSNGGHKPGPWAGRP